MNNDDFILLQSKREKIEKSLLRHEKFVFEFNSDLNDITELETRIDYLKDIYNEFNKVHSEIEDNVSLDKLQAETDKLAAFEGIYFKTLSKINFLIKQNKNEINNHGNNSKNSAVCAKSKISLPSINIADYNGSIDKWLQFRDTFKSLIHENAELTNIEKMHYLNSSLKGEAKRTIESLSISAGNYEAAWSLLHERFNNTKLIIQAHIRKIINMPAISKANSSNLRQIIDEVRNNIAALDSLGQPTKHWDSILITTITDKLDFSTARDWQAILSKFDDMPPLSNLIQFLESRTQYFESIVYNYSQNKISSNTSNIKAINHNIKSLTLSNNNQVKKIMSCVFCKRNNHFSNQCNDFQKLSNKEKLSEVNKLNLCLNCLKTGHATTFCKSINKCRQCSENHNTLLHFAIQNSQIDIQTPSTSRANLCEYKTFKLTEYLLPTAEIKIKNHQDKYFTVVALIDTGSQLNFISKSLIKKLNLKMDHTNHKINGINNSTSTAYQKTEVTIKSKINEFQSKIPCIVLEKITGNLPEISFNPQEIKIPNKLALANKNFFKSSPIELLLGTEVAFKVLKNGQVVLTDNLMLQNSLFGYLLGGKVEILNHYNTEKPSCKSLLSLEILNTQVKVKDFLSRDIVTESKSPPSTEDEIICENKFVNDHKRDLNGHFVIKLPKKDDKYILGKSDLVAKQRFFNLEKKFRHNHELKLKYKAFMDEYIELGHMKLVNNHVIHKTYNYYLPHHPIFKNGKLKVAFDASAKSSNNKSLNDNLLIGPKLHHDLFNILTRFRTHSYIINSDIKMMYRQIKLAEEDTNFHRIFWRDNPCNELQEYKLTTLTYGINSAPFIALRCLKQLAIENVEKYPEACLIINRDFFVDDLLTGSDSIEHLKTIANQLIQILKSGGFQLTKWTSNNIGCLPDTINSNENETLDISFNKDNSQKTLGIYWNCRDDSLSYKIKPIESSSVTTKREMLSKLASVYDPLGLISPVIIKMKILFQQLWSISLDWNDPIPDPINTQWISLINELESLKNIKIPRKILLDKSIKIELIGCADASQTAYGAVIYLKSYNKINDNNVQLFVAKSRVAPLKQLSIPKLELLAAQLLAQLTTKVKDIISYQIDKTYLFTDSQVVLAWLQKKPENWQSYVAHRVSVIQKLTNVNDWYHIKGCENPADIVSRGLSPSQIIKSKQWWHGNDWFKQPVENTIQNSKITLNIDQIPEKRRVLFCNTATSKQNGEIFLKYSSYTKLKRIIALLQRFIYNCLNSQLKRVGPITSTELNNANITILKSIQQQTFSEEISQLKNNNLNKKNCIVKLSPFIDSNGLLRVGGRLCQANIQYDHKFPIILPKNNHVTDIIIQLYHKKHLHAPPQATLAAIRQNFWPLSGRSRVKQLIYKCVKCFRVKPMLEQQKMGDLPLKRIEPARPFLNISIDFCGPIFLKDSKGRGKKSYKAYICLFICLSTKAVHLELVGDLSTEAFINALKRLIARRGNVKFIISDNATNFRGAHKQLKEIYMFFQNKINQGFIKNHLTENDIIWKFIPPRTPNFGGLHEAAVKSVKYHLRRVIGETILTYEEMYTLLTCIEACLNSRPLIPLSNDPNDLNALSPSHFIIGESITAPLEHDLLPLKLNKLSRWQLIQQMKQHFWKRWHSEYLSQLQGRNKWTSIKPSVKIGALVLLHEDNVPPLRWNLGRIQDVHLGQDGLARVVTVKTSNGVYRRGVNKISVVPVHDSD